jgi:hypothetical protein
VGPSSNLPLVLQVLAQTAERCGLLTQSVHLLAALTVPRSAFSAAVFGFQAAHQAAVARVQAGLDEAAFAEAWAAGAALSADAAIELGLAVVAQLQPVLATDTLADHAP